MLLDEMPPSVELLRALLAVDVPDLVDVEEQVAVIAGWERILSWVTACQHEVLVHAESAFDAPGLGLLCSDASKWFSERVGLALGVTGGSAQRRMNAACTLAEKLPTVAAALRAGEVTSHHARLLASDATTLPVLVAQAADKVAMGSDDRRTPTQLQTTFRRSVIDIDPHGAADRHRAKRRERRVSCRNEPDGMAAVWALLPADSCQAVAAKIEAHARSSAAQIAAGRRPHPRPTPRRRPRRPHPPRRHHRPPHRRRPERRLATVTRRPNEWPAAGVRPHHLPPTPGPARPHHRPRPHLPLPPATYCRTLPTQRQQRRRRTRWVETTRVKSGEAAQLGGWQHHRDPDTRNSIWTDPAGTRHTKPATALPTPPPVEPPDDDPPPF